MTNEQLQAVQEMVASWMDHAWHDMALAKMVGNDEIAPEILTFHAQQTVEKAIKALLIQRQVEFPHTHIIGELLGLCIANGYKIDENLEEANTLSRYSLSTTYPGEINPVTRNEAKLAADLANQVLNWTESQIEKN